MRHVAAIVSLILFALPGTAALAQAPAGAPASAEVPAPTTFVVKFRARPGKGAELEQAFIKMQQGVRDHEPGNVYYDFFRTAQDPQTYVIIERYKDAAAATAHGQSDHAKVLIAALKDLLDGPAEADRLVLISPKQ